MLAAGGLGKPKPLPTDGPVDLDKFVPDAVDDGFFADEKPAKSAGKHSSKAYVEICAVQVEHKRRSYRPAKPAKDSDDDSDDGNPMVAEDVLDIDMDDFKQPKAVVASDDDASESEEEVKPPPKGSHFPLSIGDDI